MEADHVLTMIKVYAVEVAATIVSLAWVIRSLLAELGFSDKGHKKPRNKG